ncbi:pacearchaeosortase [archaeon]|jgi:exosortase/archaeosortase family protein|nr:pacearchaeosortase [archaeon]MBT6182720.1 pacearchaeosortase [archaeon]MBT6606168.1 pacearchaeosortase [archaeon]MBT7251992.1 pacearchaeosortase [archaeon]MBT7660942.1 pacearchaeosortase [archaeon]
MVKNNPSKNKKITYINEKIGSNISINGQIKNLFGRYLFLVLLSIGNLAIFYKILTPLTVHTLNFFLSLTQKTQVVGNRILMEGLAVDIIPACVAGSAFYLLTILIMSIPRIKSSKRVKIISVSFLALFIANIARLVFLVSITDLANFEFIHWLFYNLLSVVFVVAIWVSIVKIYRVGGIPFYSDIKFLHCLRNNQKNPKSCKKN